MKWGTDKLIMIVGICGSITSILMANKPLMYTSFAVITCGIIFISIRFFKDRAKPKDMPYGEHPGLFATRNLIGKGENNKIVVSKLIKNVKYSDYNRTSNITYIINGAITGNFCEGFYLPISAASPVSNITSIGYMLILDEQDMIDHEDFHFIDADTATLQKFKVSFDVIKKSLQAQKLYLPFRPTPLKRDEKFQAVVYYTWKNAIISQTDSTFYYTTTLFPSGVKKLITNLVFTSKPLEAAVYRGRKKKKVLISKVKKIRQVDNSFVVRWETDNPKGVYILQRTLEKWS